MIPTTQERAIRRIIVQGQPEQKVSKTPSQQTNWVWSSQLLGGMGRRMSEASLRQKGEALPEK
jgi:hypothetical protein